MVGCPADTCEFDGSIPEVADHIAESNDERHTWKALGYKNIDELNHDNHLKEGQRLQEVAQEARDHGKFDVAIEELEGALYHFQRAKLFADDASHIGNRCREVLTTIDEIETTEQIQVIDDFVNGAETAIDAGDEAHFEDDYSLTRQKYKEAVDALKEARTLATELAPDRVEGIDRHLRSVRVRQQSLEMSEPHRAIRQLAADAREHTAAGDRAFHDSEYETVLKEYENASNRYKSLAECLQEFSFAESTADPMTCDVCRHQFEEELDFWRINLGVSLRVCPACALFGSDGDLPNPQTVATEHRIVIENIESIRDGDVGLDWTSDASTQSDSSEDIGSDGDSRDARQMLIQLVGLCQQLGEQPTAGELDEHTDFGYLAYRDEFGSLTDAIQAAGLRD